MSITSKRELFDRELRKLYHAEIEILDLHSDLSDAAASEEVRAIFDGHEGDTVDQIDRIKEIFAVLDMEPREQGSPIMEGLLAEKDQFVAEVEDDDLRDLDVISIGMINERLEITLLDRLLLLVEELGLPEPTAENLEANRSEAQAALERMQQFLEDRRVEG
jgi:ferritin-like metal-binding protein YciE